MWKNTVESDRPQMTIRHGPWALHAGQLKQKYRQSQYSLLVHGNDGSVTRTQPVLFPFSCAHRDFRRSVTIHTAETPYFPVKYQKTQDFVRFP